MYTFSSVKVSSGFLELIFTDDRVDQPMEGVRRADKKAGSPVMMQRSATIALTSSKLERTRFTFNSRSAAIRINTNAVAQRTFNQKLKVVTNLVIF